MFKNKVFNKYALISSSVFIVLVLILKNHDFIKDNSTIQNYVNKVKDERENACIFTLCRESELDAMVGTIRTFEQRFNSKYHYDYVMINDVEFSEKFKETIRNNTKSVVKFGRIPPEQWSYPKFIDQEKAKNERIKMHNNGGSYGLSESYRFMCRYFSGFFFRHPLVESYEQYWRLEPNVNYPCNVNFDPFKYMKENGYEYGFTISTVEGAVTIPTLWSQTLKFIAKYPQYIDSKSNSLKFVNNTQNGDYNLCHYWSNFEIASFKLWRSEKYLKYFEHLEKAGGFFYERWGDAPVHSIALSMFLPKNKIKFFDDIGYYHYAWEHCPSSPTASMQCSCKPENSFDFAQLSCLKKWFYA